MTGSLLSGALLLFTAADFAAADCGQPNGADLVVDALTSTSNFGTVDGVAAFAAGTTVCNIGTAPNLWEATSSHHPVIIQNLYRLQPLPDGTTQFEQIGLSWAMHAIVPLSAAACCPCAPTSGALAAGCSDTSSASINSYQPRLAPRLEINPSTSTFVFPGAFDGTTGDIAYKRLQVAIADLHPALNPGAQYFLETQFLSDDDAAAINHYNNAAFREAVVSGTGDNWQLSLIGSSNPQRPAIGAWADAVPSVVTTDVLVSETTGPKSRLMVAANATDLGDGTWHYEYAVYNMNSDRAVGAFAVPLDHAASVNAVGFHDVDFHSGDGVGSTPANPINMDGTDWASAHTNGVLRWATLQTHDANPNGNAIRWGTVYNFRFTTHAPPQTGPVTLELFKPGVPASITADSLVPASIGVALDGDFDGDGDVDTSDFATFAQCFGGSFNPPAATCPAGVDADLDDDTDVDLGDFAIFSQNFTGAQ